jgi:hypothetical protein
MMVAVIHAFEERGLGTAPFAYSHEIDMGSIKNGATCDFCGTAIRYCEVIKSADGKTFAVGNECVRKTGDRGLIDTVKRESARQRAQAKWDAQHAEHQAQLAVERERNGGPTDYEIAEAKREAEEQARAEAIARENYWIVRLLPYGSSWAESMRYSLENTCATKFSERNKTIFAEIYAKSHGRKGSKAYGAAYDEAWDRLGDTTEATK